MNHSAYTGFSNLKSSLSALKARTMPRGSEGRQLEGSLRLTVEDLRVRDIASRWAHVREQFDKNRKNRVEALEDYLVDLDKRIAEVVNESHINVLCLLTGRNRKKLCKTFKRSSLRFRLISRGWMTAKPNR